MNTGARTTIAVLLAAAVFAACNSQSAAPTDKEIPNPPGSFDHGTSDAGGIQKGATPIADPAGRTTGRSLASRDHEGRPARPPALDFPQAPDRDLFELASQLIPAAPKSIPRVVNPQPVSYIRGRTDSFWLFDLEELDVYRKPFELLLVTPHAYWYVEEGQKVGLQDLEQAAGVFEETIYPRLTSAFGQEWTPGVDNDPHLNILNGALKGSAGYFSSGDEYPEEVSPHSNQREIIYINMAAYPPESPHYLEVLAHELQHAIHWRADPSEETWINEGLSELATTIAGFSPRSISRFLETRPTSVIHWPLDHSGVQASYGAASLFMHYLIEHYGDPNDVKPLLRQQEDGMAGIQAYLADQGHPEDFQQVFENWMAANVLDLDFGPYSYSTLDVQARHHRTISGDSNLESSIPQYAPEYIRLKPADRPLHLTFRAPAENTLLPVDVGAQGCWWSNSGDSINATLTRTLDLTEQSHVTLEYQIWYDLEDKWDYAYLEVSEDAGRSWAIIETPGASPANPVGAAYGPGYTGSSAGWLDQSINLTRYAGNEIQVRFQYVTDDAINGSGACLRGFSLLFDRSRGLAAFDLPGSGWHAKGFALIDNRVRQDYTVQVIGASEKGWVKAMDLKINDAGDWAGELLIEDFASADSLIVAVAAFAPKTRMSASYSLSVAPIP